MKTSKQILAPSVPLNSKFSVTVDGDASNEINNQYKITLTEAGTLNLSLLSSSSSLLDIRVLDINNSAVLSPVSSLNSVSLSGVLQPGDYYVQAYTSNASTLDLTVSFHNAQNPAVSPAVIDAPTPILPVYSSSKLLANSSSDFVLGAEDLTFVADTRDSLAYGLQDTNYFSAGDYKVSLGAGNDTMISYQGSDSIDGGDGNDVIDAGDGRNNIKGGAGNDSLTSGSDSDIIEGGDGLDVIDAGDGANSVKGGSGDDSIISGSGHDTIDGGDGVDYIDDAGGRNNIKGGAGNDEVYTGSGRDVIDAGDGDDYVASGFGRDNIKGGKGNDTLRGAQGDDTIDGGDGNDNIDGGLGSNNIKGGAGNDSIYIEGNGNDIVDGGEGNDDVFTSSGNDIIKTGNGLDTIESGAGNDIIDAGAGNDVIFSYTGSDTVTGGAGNDVFVTFKTDSVFDTIKDFKSGEDSLVLFNQSWLPWEGGAYTFTLASHVQLDSSHFVTSTTNSFNFTASDSYGYNTKTGALFFDADGSGAGEAVQIALIANKAAIVATDILI